MADKTILDLSSATPALADSLEFQVAAGGAGSSKRTTVTNLRTTIGNGITLVAPALGTPASGTLTNCTGLPISTGVAGLGTGVVTFLATPSSANLAAAVTGETGTGALVFATSPALVTPALGTPASGVLTNCTAFNLTTTGSSGPATYSAGTLNIPQYSGVGGGGDWVSTLTSAEIAITGATTATISRQHSCAATSADYTVTLPAASGNGGKFIALRMLPTNTKIVTVDGNGGETIDGNIARFMWAGEACLLYCDGSNWFKVAGKTIPMQTRLTRDTDQGSISTSTWTAVDMTAQAFGTPQMFDSGNNRVTIARPGVYMATGRLLASGVGGTIAYFGPVANETTGWAQDLPMTQLFVDGGFAQGASNMGLQQLGAGDFVELLFFAGSGTPVIAGATAPASISVIEVPQW